MTNVVKFYNNSLSLIQRNAKKLAKHPVLSNVDNIRDQLGLLKAKHRRFIFAYLNERYGDDRARDLIQLKIVKDSINNFKDLNAETLRQIDSLAILRKPMVDLAIKMKHSFYYRHVKPHIIRKEVVIKLKSEMPDLLSLPKLKHIA